MCLKPRRATFQRSSAFSKLGLNRVRLEYAVIGLSRKRWEIGPKLGRLLLGLSLIVSGMRPFRLHENHWSWMTLNVSTCNRNVSGWGDSESSLATAGLGLSCLLMVHDFRISDYNCKSSILSRWEVGGDK